MVTLCDLKLRKFEKRIPNSMDNKNYNDDARSEQSKSAPTTASTVRTTFQKFKQQQELLRKLGTFIEVEKLLNQYKSKLNASLARCRIRLSIPSLNCILPDSVKKAETMVPDMFVTFWVNQLKVSCLRVFSIDKMVHMLDQCGFQKVEIMESNKKDLKMLLAGNRFVFDRQCYDVIHVGGHHFEFFENNEWRKKRLIILQDRSSSVAVHSLFNLSNQGDDDVIHVNPGSGLTSGHMVSLVHASKGCGKVYCTEIASGRWKLMRNLTKMGAMDKIIIIDRLSTKHRELNDVKLALVTSPCSKSGLVNPVNFLMNEGEAVVQNIVAKEK
ncbi:hypothetical protein HELRODRAFT_174730 [Helobdella robusta]|uniref:SAM-dependent MTase RsmB/NOP-type domain-containing protein n=1 Tax=Helobdella robusta TaxID=6412 RepID=T1F8E9_HELRO|nr:hypothetical protein HELRODRAFT_174730 [Helobdella robusta]ESO01746.1 hypothetical protein HELRODRAFT_174730 [Helobdella robusta]